ncbi:MAG TPA: hypothetical protein VG816_09130 [Solirubrobacterales bacterium]|nr:hypothetical protein [Solirubrobacterales bacterium]
MTAGEAEEGSLPLDLSLVAPDELEAAWSGSRSASPWRGRLGDGNELAIAWGEAGDLLFDYSGGARFLFDPSRPQLACAPLDPTALEWQRVLLSRVLPDLALAYGCEALHAAAVETPLGVIAIAAPSGTGKSSLAAELMRRGASLFADDVLVLSRRGGTVVAHPGSPHANLAPASEPERLGEVLAEFGGERWIGARRASRKVSRVAAIALLEREGGLPLAVSPLAASPLVLAPHMLGLPDDEPGREASRFALYSDLVASAALLRVSGGDGDDPAALADVLERELASLPATGVAA